MFGAPNVPLASRSASGHARGRHQRATHHHDQSTIKGDNPAAVNVGATYSDLGATITGHSRISTSAYIYI